MAKNILIIKPSSLGDIVMALPTLASLRKSFPDARISWLIRPEFAPILENVSGLDEIIIFDRNFMGKWWYNLKAAAVLLRLIAKLRKGKFDTVIDLQGLFRTGLFAWLSGSKHRFGPREAREMAGMFYNKKVSQPGDSMHVTDHYLKIAAAAGASVVTNNYNIRPTQKSVDGANELLSANGLSESKYAVLIVGSAHRHKCWPSGYFAELAQRIVSQLSLSIIAVGTRSEKPAVESLKSKANVPIVDLAGLTDLGQLTALLKGASLVVSNDTGPGNIAAALGVRLVIIYGPTNPARLMPYKRPDKVAANQVEKRGTVIKSSDPEYAIEKVTVQQVWEKIICQVDSR